MATQKTETKAKSKTAAKGKSVAQRSATVRKQIKEVMGAVEKDHMELAELLAEAYNRKYWEEWGFEDFKVYCNDELDVHWRKAYYFVDIWNKVAEYNLNLAEVKKIGWTKMKEVAAVMTKRNYKGLMAKALKQTSREFAETVKIIRAKQKGTDVRPVTTTIVLKCNEDEAKGIMEALSEAKKLTESANDTVAFEMICSDWLQDKGAVPEATPLESKVAYLENAYGVKLKVVGKPSAPKTKAKAKTPAPDKTKTSGKKATGKAKAKAEDTEQDIDDLLGL